jgi:3-hydroxyisobutyrate dehydrogenase/2-hydroxy-3-oxopropionate reductase
MIVNDQCKGAVMQEIGVCGAGVMGQAAIGKLVEAGRSVVFTELRESARVAAVQLGATAMDSQAALADAAEIVLLFLPGPAEVTDCVSGPRGLLAAGGLPSVIVDLSTVDAGTSTTLAKEAEKHNVGYLDAPVLGRPSAVGNWALPVGGHAVHLDKARPVLSSLAARIIHVGESGVGNRVKLLNQLMFGAINAMTAEMMAIASKTGVPPKLLYETITASQAGTVSNLFKELGKRISEDRYDEPTFTVDLLVKDVRLAVRMADENQAPPLLGRVIDYINTAAQAHGYGGSDTAAMWNLFKNL